MEQDLATTRADELNPDRSKSGADKLGRWRYLVAFAVTFVSLYILNFHFHLASVADFLDRDLQGRVPVRELGPLSLIVIYALSALAMMAIVAGRPATVSPLRAAVLGGGLVGLLTFGTWNLLNYARVPGWPLYVVLVDTASHVVCGLLSGAALARWLPSSRSRA
jgi:uncharacterized membrane protein